MSSTQPEPHIIMTKSDGGQRSYALMVDGQQLAAFDTLLENLDLLYKSFWAWNLKYTPSVQHVYKCLDYIVFGMRVGRTANCVRELAGILDSTARQQ